MLLKLRKFLGGILIIISFIMGATSVGIGFGEPIFVTIIMYLLLGILPLILAFFLIEGKQMFKKLTISNFRSLLVNPGVRVYVFITIITPVLLNILDTLKFSNMDRLSSPGDVYFANISVEWLGYIIVFAGLTAFMSFARLFAVGWKKCEKHIRYAFILSFTIAIFISVIINNDYKTINQNGLVISTLGNKEEIPWSDVEHVYLKGSITSDGFSKTSGSSFKWKFEFLLKNGESEEFGSFTYLKDNLEDSLNIKELLAEKKISVTSDRLFDEEWDYVQIDMKYEEEAKPEDFYSIFNYDPKTGEYYYIPY
ncbi:hypothetical protein CJ195_09650 [Bacillus sp. UMB0899]|nr:hypothetical protein CJ195_09650 [Bacillus sp. UMB0899]